MGEREGGGQQGNTKGGGLRLAGRGGGREGGWTTHGDVLTDSYSFFTGSSSREEGQRMKKLGGAAKAKSEKPEIS